MITELLPIERELGFGKGSLSADSRKMDQPELSLGPSLSGFVDGSVKSSSSDSDANSRKKRKHYYNSWDDPVPQASLELQLNDPLPPDWEQCLDLQSGRMYYVNRKTLEKSLIRPKEQALNLDLNISTFPMTEASFAATASPEGPSKSLHFGGNMAAVRCLNCHLLVMLWKSSPSCPNCKFVHNFPPAIPQASPRKAVCVKSLETLSLLH